MPLDGRGSSPPRQVRRDRQADARGEDRATRARSSSAVMIPCPSTAVLTPAIDLTGVTASPNISASAVVSMFQALQSQMTVLTNQVMTLQNQVTTSSPRSVTPTMVAPFSIVLNPSAPSTGPPGGPRCIGQSNQDEFNRWEAAGRPITPLGDRWPPGETWPTCKDTRRAAAGTSRPRSRTGANRAARSGRRARTSKQLAAEPLLPWLLGASRHWPEHLLT